MLGLARAFISDPLLLVNEPSLGLSHHLVQQMFTALENLNREGLTILLVEQNLYQNLRSTGRTYVLEQSEPCRRGPVLNG